MRGAVADVGRSFRAVSFRARGGFAKRARCLPHARRATASLLRCLMSPTVGLLGGTAVLLYSVDQKTRQQGGKQRLPRRMRPPRVFEPQLPQLRTLEEAMVVRFQLVVESAPEP